MQNVLYHYKDMNTNERLEQREKLRDELMQMLTQWDTIMVCTTLLLGCTFEYICQGTPGLPTLIKDHD